MMWLSLFGTRLKPVSRKVNGGVLCFVKSFCYLDSIQFATLFMSVSSAHNHRPNREIPQIKDN